MEINENYVNVKDNKGRTAIHIAALYGKKFKI